MNRKDLVRQRFGKLTVLEDTGDRTTYGNVLWKCVCDCGNTVVVSAKNLMRSHTKSCGCLHKEVVRKMGQKNKRHGYKGKPIYNSWHMMKERCLNPNATGYEYWGGRGIMICERWMVFENFLADMGERPEGTTLDRIDNNGHYEPSNCKWSTIEEQNNNRFI